MQNVTDVISELSSIEEGWDGYGGKGPTEEAISAAANLINCIAIVPDPGGGLQVELHTSICIVELNISPKGDVIQAMMDCEKPKERG